MKKYMYGTQVTFYSGPLICQNFILDLDMDMGALSRNHLNFVRIYSLSEDSRGGLMGTFTFDITFIA